MPDVVGCHNGSLGCTHKIKRDKEYSMPGYNRSSCIYFFMNSFTSYKLDHGTGLVLSTRSRWDRCVRNLAFVCRLFFVFFFFPFSCFVYFFMVVSVFRKYCSLIVSFCSSYFTFMVSFCSSYFSWRCSLCAVYSSLMPSRKSDGFF